MRNKYLLWISVLLSCVTNFCFAQTPPVRPYFNVSTDAANVTYAETVVKSFTEAQWLNLVPTQAPRSLQLSPADPTVNTWTWSTSTPNQITDGNGVVFPNATYPVSYADIKVMSGKIVKVPYNNTSKGITFVQAQIDYQKMRYISSKMYNMSVAYQITKNEKYARYVALAMDKLANVVPDYFMTQGWNVNKLVSVDDISSYRDIGGFLQRASDHNGITYELDDNSILAFDGIYDSQALKTLTTERGYDVRKHIENDLFLNETLWLKDQPTMNDHLTTNLPKYAENMVQVAAICSDVNAKTSILDFVDKYVSAIIARNFRRDGMYPESIGYHNGYANDFLSTVKILDKYFTLFPPTTPVLSNIASHSADRLAFAIHANSVQDSVSFPNGDLAPFGDTHSGGSSTRTATKSYLLPAYQHGMLGDGTGNQQIQANIGANDMANHIGNEMMTMTMYAFGNEQIGDIRYSHIPGRMFTRSTVSHNLVNIDLSGGQYSSNAQIYGDSGHIFTNGYFTLFETGLKGVSTTEVYSNTIKPGTVTRYQRLQVLNTIDISTPYLIDVFVVNGGKTHDYILNGSTQVDQTGSSSLPLTYINSTYPLLPAGQTYTDPVAESDNRNWYGALREMSSGTSNGNWNVTFQNAKSGGVKIFTVDDATSTLYLGKSPYAYRQTLATSMYAYWRPVMLERRIGTNTSTKSVFVHVIEAFGSTSGIASVTKLPLVTESSEYVALSIVFKNGRKDVALINLNNSLITGSNAVQTIQTADNQYAVTGKVGLFSTVNSMVNGYLIQGSNLTHNTNKLDIPNSTLSGTITGVTRKADGALYDAFITSAAIPAGDELKGKWISVKFGVYSIIAPTTTTTTQSAINELFKIDGVRIVNGKTYIVCSEDHQLTMSGTVTTELVRPQRKFNGLPTFTIYSSQKIVFSGLKKQSIAFKVGWNLISINQYQQDSSIAKIFAGLNVQEIKNADGFWIKGQNIAFNSLKTINAGKGYLVKMNVAGVLNISGIPSVETLQIKSLRKGWNLIGCPYQTTTSFTTLFNALNTTIIKDFEGFWTPNGTINSIQNLVPGKAYYVKEN